MSALCYEMSETSLKSDSRKGLDVWQAAFAVKIYKSHRQIGQIGEVIKELELQEKNVPK